MSNSIAIDNGNLTCDNLTTIANVTVGGQLNLTNPLTISSISSSDILTLSATNIIRLYDANWEYYKREATTTDATLTSIATFPVATNTGISLMLDSAMYCTTGTDAGKSSLISQSYRARNVSGTVTVFPVINTINRDTGMTVAITLTASGTSVVLSIQGEASNTYKWTVGIKLIKTS
jgi:hypothetical protein